MADVQLKQVPFPTQLSVITLHTGVYEVSVDTATGKTGKLMKQSNPPILCTTFTAARHMGVTYEEILAAAKRSFTHETEPLKEFQLYPLMVNQLVKDPDYVAETDRMNYTVILGYAVEERKADPRKPIVAPADVEGRTKAVEEALTPKLVLVPFVLAVPEDPRYMFYISYDFTPPAAVREWDSSVKEEDPLLNQDSTEGNPMFNDSTELAHISPNDITLYNQIRDTMNKFLEKCRSGEIPVADPNRPDHVLENVASQLDISVDEVQRCLRLFEIPVAEAQEKLIDSTDVVPVEASQPVK